MAFNQKRVYINTNKVKNAPDGHTIPTAELAIGTPDLEEEETLEFTVSTYSNANAATGFDALIAAVETAIDTLIDTTWGVDIVAKTVDYNAEVIKVSRPDSIFLADANAKYNVTFNLSVVIS